MPKVTRSRFSAAWFTAVSMSFRNLARSPIQESALSTTITPSGTRCSMTTRARARQGAVLRPSGSTSTFWDGSSGSIFRVSSASSSVVSTKMSSGRKAPSSRCTVWCRRDSFPTMVRNCLGRLPRDRGQNRVPRPPARMTASLRCSLCVCAISTIPQCPSAGSLAYRRRRYRENDREFAMLFVRVHHLKDSLKPGGGAQALARLPAWRGAMGEVLACRVGLAFGAGPVLAAGSSLLASLPARALPWRRTDLGAL